MTPSSPFFFFHPDENCELKHSSPCIADFWSSGWDLVFIDDDKLMTKLNKAIVWPSLMQIQDIPLDPKTCTRLVIPGSVKHPFTWHLLYRAIQVPAVSGRLEENIFKSRENFSFITFVFDLKLFLVTYCFPPVELKGRKWNSEILVSWTNMKNLSGLEPLEIQTDSDIMFYNSAILCSVNTTATGHSLNGSNWILIQKLKRLKVF